MLPNTPAGTQLPTSFDGEKEGARHAGLPLDIAERAHDIEHTDVVELVGQVLRRQRGSQFPIR